MTICQKNFYHVQELQKQAQNKSVKPRSYAPSDKVWVNSKYIKSKQNPKLKAKFIRPFQVLYPISKQAYKLELQRKWRIYNVFHMLLQKQYITRKERIDKNVTEFEAGNSKEYKVGVIGDNAVYVNKAKDYLTSLYYLLVQKRYLKEENTWEPSSAVQHLKKLIIFFYKKYPEKSTATFPSINSASLITRPKIKFRPTTKQKQG